MGVGKGEGSVRKVDPSNVNNGCDVNAFVFNNQRRLIVIAKWITGDLTPGKTTNNCRKSVMWSASIDNIRVKLKGQWPRWVRPMRTPRKEIPSSP